MPAPGFSSVFLEALDAFGEVLLPWIARRLSMAPAIPGVVSAHAISQGDGTMKLAPILSGAPVDLTDPLNSDLAWREVHVQSANDEEQLIRIPFDPANEPHEPTQEELDANPDYHFDANRDEDIVLFLIHEDSTGNRTIAGPPTTVHVTDNIPPAVPGALGAHVVGQ